MPFNGSGTFNRVRNWTADAAAAIKIRADYHDSEDDGFAAGLSQCITRDGQSTISADISWNNKKLTNLATPTAGSDAVTKAYVDTINTTLTNGKVNRAGDTMTGNLTIAPASGVQPAAVIRGTGATGAQLQIDKGASGQTAYIQGMTAGVPRWQIQLCDATAESANAGSNFAVGRFNDAGIFQGFALTIARLTGNVTLSSDLSVAGSMYCTDSGVNYRVCLVSGGQIYTGSFSNHVVNVQVNNAVRGTWNTTGLIVSGTIDSGAITANGTVESSGTFRGAGATAILATAVAGTCYLRPNGSGSATGETKVTSGGDMTVNGQITFQATLQSTGGIIMAATSGGGLWLRPTGAASTTGQVSFSAAGAGVFTHDSQAKPTAGGFVASSDARIKTVQRDYTTGLAAINALRPVVFTYLGNDTDHVPGEDPADEFLSDDLRAESRKAKEGIDYSTAPYPDSIHYQLAVDGTERVGFVAQEIEQVLPSTVTQREGYIDGQLVSDLRDFDPTNIIYALVVAVQELSARVEALEAA